MREVLRDIIISYNSIVIFYFLILNFFYLALLFLATGQLFYYRRKHKVRIFANQERILAPRIAILCPAYNEGNTIVENVGSLLKVKYPELEVVVINDGSTDNTLSLLKKEFRLFEVPKKADGKIATQLVRKTYRSAVDVRLMVIDKENGGGKADALNAGLNYSRGHLFCAMDADSIIEPDALGRIMLPYLEIDWRTVGVGGIVRIINGCKVEKKEVVEARLPKQWLPCFQAMEYIRAFLCGRAGWNTLNSLLIISGAFGLFDRKAVMEIGGYSTHTVGEDIELVVRLHRTMREKKKPYRMHFAPDPVCWTQVPDTLKDLGQQRNRWQRGLVETLFQNWRMIGNPRYGFTGMLGMPYFLIFEALGPVVEFSGYIVVTLSFIFGWIHPQLFFLFLGLAVLFGVLLSLFSLVLEEFTVKRYERPQDISRLFLFAVLENLGYRQINSYWRTKAIFDLFRRKRSWGTMNKKSFMPE